MTILTSHSKLLLISVCVIAILTIVGNGLIYADRLKVVESLAEYDFIVGGDRKTCFYKKLPEREVRFEDSILYYYCINNRYISKD